MQLKAASVAQGRAGNDLDLGNGYAGAFHQFRQNAFFKFGLIGKVNVHHVAAAATAVKGAGRLDPLGRALQHIHNLGLVVVPKAFCNLYFDLFAGNGKGNEYVFVVDFGQAFSAKNHFFHCDYA